MIEALMIPLVIAACAALCALIGLAINALADARSERSNRRRRAVHQPRSPRIGSAPMDEPGEDVIRWLMSREASRQ